MVAEVAALSEHLTDREWLAEIEAIGDVRGYFEPVGRGHSALFLDESLEVLLVSFDTVASARAGSASGIPHGMLHAEINGWSSLSLLAHEPSWFRSRHVYAFFDRMVDDGFFEDFDRVIFYGTGMSAYAAAAYSVAAPGATVIVAAPQATLDPAVAPWDDRFTGKRRIDFTSRYGFAPDMLEAASRAFIVYDPLSELDAMHASLFRGPHVEHIRFRHAGSRIGQDLQEMQVMGPLFRKAAEGSLEPLDFYRALRARRKHMPYLRSLLNRTHIDGRLWLTALLARAVLREKDSPRFRHHLELAEHKLAVEGRALPEPRRRMRAADRFPNLI